MTRCLWLFFVVGSYISCLFCSRPNAVPGKFLGSFYGHSSIRLLRYLSYLCHMIHLIPWLVPICALGYTQSELGNTQSSILVLTKEGKNGCIHICHGSVYICYEITLTESIYTGLWKYFEICILQVPVNWGKGRVIQCSICKGGKYLTKNVKMVVSIIAMNICQFFHPKPNLLWMFMFL